MIEAEDLDITEINLAKIADEYVNYIRGAEAIDPEEMADFLVVAAKLLYIKSKALLPYLYTAEDEAEVDDLEKQLRMYKEFVSASQKVKELAAANKVLYLRPFVKNRRNLLSVPAFVAPIKVNSPILHEVYIRILTNLEKELEKKLPEEHLEPKINIEDRILQIKKMLFDKIRINFSMMLASAENKTEVIVSFLAVLELAKQKELIFEQDELFSEIHISRSE